MERRAIAVLVALGMAAMGGSAEAHGARAGVGVGAQGPRGGVGAQGPRGGGGVSAVIRSPHAVTRPVHPHAFPHRFHAFPRSFVIVNPYPLYVAPPPVYIPPPVTYVPSYSPALAAPGDTYVGAAPDVAPMPSVVQYPHGRYELRGDGINVPYVWVWIPNPPPPPPDPGTSYGS